MSIRNLEFSESGNSVTEKYSLIKRKARKSKTELYTEVIGIDGTGQTLFTGNNKLLINGSLLLLFKAFGITTANVKPKSLNTIYNFYPDELTPELHAQSKIFLFGVGSGGTSNGYDALLKELYKEVDIKSMVPFRYSKDNVTGSERYYFIRRDGDYNAYYLKTFEAVPIIKSVYLDGTEVPNNADELDRDDIETFAELKLKVSTAECREWFAIKGGGIEKSKINTLSLVTAVDYKKQDMARNEAFMAKLATKINFQSEPLSSEKEINIIYRIYI